MNLYIVTGTTKGLGKALVEKLGEDAENEVIALARAPDGPIRGGEQFNVDLADAKALEAAFDRVEARIAGKKYAKAVLVNNAGVVSPVGPIERASPGEIERSLQVNLVAPVLLMRRFLRATEGVAVRRIVNISSGAGRRPYAGWAVYCTSKAGLDMASRSVALDCEAQGRKVTIASLAPGVIDTPMQGVVRGSSKADFPDVERFKQMKAEGTLRPAADVAADILRAEAAGKLEGDVLLDLRQLA